MLPAARHGSRLPDRRLVLSVQSGGIAFLLEEPGRSSALGIPGVPGTVPIDGLAAALRRALAGRRPLPVGIRFRSSDCLVRTVELPTAAHRDFARMLLLDLERATPLKSSDVHSAYVVESTSSARGMALVRQFVIKSRMTEPVRAQLRAAGLDATFIDCWNSDGTAPLPIDFRNSGLPARPMSNATAGRWIAGLAVILGASAAAIHWGKQELALGRLTAETSRQQEQVREIERSAAQVRADQSRIEIARRLKAERMPATLILDEVTRLLPDTAWLQEFRLDSDVVEIVGLAASASSLLPAFDRSPLFHQSSFTAPLRQEAGEDRERFRLRTRLRPAAVGAGAPRSQVVQ